MAWSACCAVYKGERFQDYSWIQDIEADISLKNLFGI